LEVIRVETFTRTNPAGVRAHPAFRCGVHIPDFHISFSQGHGVLPAPGSRFYSHANTAHYFDCKQAFIHASEAGDAEEAVPGHRHLYSLAVRKNPFNSDAKIVIE
jgi:hypothetical protein